MKMKKDFFKIKTRFDLDDLFYNVMPGFLYRFVHWLFNFRSHKRAIRFFFQRMIRGWDDSETWDLDCRFYKWIAPRLKRLEQLNVCYPGNDKYPTFKCWQNELKFRATEAKVISECYYDEDKIPVKYVRKYLTKEQIDEINKKRKGLLMSETLWAMQNSFDKWFCENRHHLWW